MVETGLPARLYIKKDFYFKLDAHMIFLLNRSHL